jgi:hypothetical protein
VFGSGHVFSQAVCLPLPRLLTTMPMGGAIGTTAEVTLSGEQTDDVSALFFNDPRLTATPKTNAEGKAEANKFVVTIASDCPPGLYEARVMSRLGVSSARIFSVGSLNELSQSAANTSLATAIELPVNSVINAATTNKSVDHYAFQAAKGQRYIIYCAARGIDSKLDPVVIVADANGKDLLVERRGDVLDFVAKEDGKHVIKVHELTFKGGPAYFYRLSLQESTAESPIPLFASTKNVSAFSWPPAGLHSQAASNEVEPNNLAGNAQTIALPCDIAGSFYPAADVDVFEFTGAKGETWWVELASDRLGRPTDPAILVQHVTGEPGNETVTDIVEFSDIASQIKPSTNGYAYDGPPFDGGSTDVLGKLEIKQDGKYRLQVTDLFGGTRKDARNVYRLIIRKAAPDFAIAAWGLHMELRNGDRNALSKPLALRAGATVALEVVAFRRDGFDGDIDLRLDGLPDGVTAQGLKIPSGKSRGIMLITAHQEAPNSLAQLAFSGRATIDGNSVTRPVQMAQMAWPIPDAWNEIPSPRLVDGMPLSVTNAEYAPISIASKEPHAIESTVGAKVTIPLVYTKRSDFSGSVVQLKAFGDGFERIPPFNISIDASGSDAVIDLASLKTPPGDYTFAFYGGAVAKYKAKPDASPQDIVELIVTEPITLHVKPAETK